MLTYPEILAGASAIAAEAAQLLARMQSAPRAATRKELNDVVTDADLAAEKSVLAGIARLTPGAAILSEEAGALAGSAAERWIVDPLDGTVNYAARLPWFSVTLAYQRDGVTRAGVVHAPAVPLVATWAEGEGARIDGRPARVSQAARLADAVVSVVLTSHFDARTVDRTAEVVRRLGGAARGVRIVVSGGLEMSLVAAGQLDGFVSLKADVVSHAAAMPLLRAAGGRITRPDGTEAGDEDEERIASNGLLHDELLGLLRGA